MWYLDKKWILEHLGKDGKDVRWLDRAISKWIVWHDVEDTWGYILCTEYIEELQEENVKLMIKAWLLPWYKLNEKEEEKKEEKSEPVEVHDDWEVERLKQELYEAKTNSDYWEKMYNEEVKDKQNRIRKAFLWIKNIKPSANWEEFRDWILNDNE